MSFDIERIHKSTRRITKFLRRNSKRPSSDAVHDLRTSTRGLETTFLTLGLDANGRIKRLSRELRALRKRAGKIRDMDVLTADALTMKQDGEQDCLVQLLEYLGAGRSKYVRKLRLAIRRSGPQCRRDLKQSSRRIEKLLKKAESNPAKSDAVPITMSKTLKLASELKDPARLNRNNLHEYRLKVKELRNVLQMSNASDTQ